MPETHRGLRFFSTDAIPNEEGFVAVEVKVFGGIHLTPKLIERMQAFVDRERIAITQRIMNNEQSTGPGEAPSD